jgi:hypothetical protein
VGSSQKKKNEKCFKRSSLSFSEDEDFMCFLKNTSLMKGEGRTAVEKVWKNKTKIVLMQEIDILVHAINALIKTARDCRGFLLGSPNIFSL